MLLTSFPKPWTVTQRGERFLALKRSAPLKVTVLFVYQLVINVSDGTLDKDDYVRPDYSDSSSAKMLARDKQEPHINLHWICRI